MAQALKVGDRVRITGSRGPNDAWIGMEAEVTTTPRTAGAMHDRKTFLRPLGKRPWGEGNFWWTTDHLEKIDPEPKFQIGDEVELEWVQHSTYRILGRAADLDHKDASYDWRLLNLRTGTRINALESELTKIKAGSEFQIGDRARDSFGKGVVTVTATDAHPSWPIQARHADGTLGLWKESELTKVESVPFKLERGDKVVNIKTGREGEVIHDLVFDTKPPFGAPVPVKAVEEYEEHHPGTYDLIKAKAPW